MSSSSPSRQQYEPSLALIDDVWEVGGVPKESFVAPWSVHSPRIEDLAAWQGRISETFVDRAVEEMTNFLVSSRA